MANKRIIASNIFEDDFFGQLTMLQRLLWIGLFSACADDQGRMIDNPTVIRSKVFPYDDIPVADIDAALNLFAAENRVIRYTDERGKGYVQLTNWWKNQDPQWAMPSKYPAPEGWKDRVRSYIKGVYNCENWPEKAQKPPKNGKSEHAPVSDHLDVPPGQSTLPAQVAGHEINPNPNPEINPNQIIDKEFESEKTRDSFSSNPELDKLIPGINYSPAQAWASAKKSCETEMPIDRFRKNVSCAWLKEFDPERNRFTIAAPSDYARDWLESRLASTVVRLLTGICNRTIQVQFVTAAPMAE